MPSNIVSLLALAGSLLGQAEQFIAGQTITVTVPTETIDISGVKVEISGTLNFKKG